MIEMRRDPTPLFNLRSKPQACIEDFTENEPGHELRLR
jgi:hypothetical protein